MVVGAITGAAGTANKWWIDLLVSCGLGAYSYYSTDGVPLEKIASAMSTFIAAETVSLLPSVSSLVFEHELKPVLQNGNTFTEKVTNYTVTCILQRNIGIKQNISSYLPSFIIKKSVHSFVHLAQDTYNAFNHAIQTFSALCSK